MPKSRENKQAATRRKLRKALKEKEEANDLLRTVQERLRIINAAIPLDGDSRGAAERRERHIRGLDAEVGTLKQELQQSQDMNSLMKRTFDTRTKHLNAKIRQLSNKCFKLKSQHRSESSKCRELKEKLLYGEAELRETTKQLADSRESMEAQLQHKSEMCDELRHQLQFVVSEHNKLSSRLSSGLRQCDQLRSGLQCERKNQEHLVACLDDVSMENRQLKAQLEGRECDIRSLSCERSALFRHLSQCGHLVLQGGQSTEESTLAADCEEVNGQLQQHEDTTLVGAPSPRTAYQPVQFNMTHDNELEMSSVM